MRHYCYRHIRNDTGQPFYVGIGTKYDLDKNGMASSREIEYRRAYSFKNKARSKDWHNIFTLCNGNIEVEIIYESSSIKEIKDKENEFLETYGRVCHGGLLVNKNFSAGTNWGWQSSDDFRNKIRQIRTGWRLSEETKKKIGNGNQGKKRTEEFKKFLSDLHKSKPRSEKQIAHFKSIISTKRPPKTKELREEMRRVRLSRLTPLNTRTIIQYDLDGNLASTYLGTRMAERVTGVFRSNIKRCLNGGSKTAGGFRWGSCDYTKQ